MNGHFAKLVGLVLSGCVLVTADTLRAENEDTSPNEEASDNDTNGDENEASDENLVLVGDPRNLLGNPSNLLRDIDDVKEDLKTD